MDTSLLPRTPKARKYEIYGLGLRDFAGLKTPERRLDPFKLARFARLLVVDFEAVRPMLSEATVAQLTGDGRNDWSGGATSIALPSGEKLIVLNPAQSKTRQKATLMEEISHVFLGHKASRLAVETKAADGSKRARDYHAEIEEEAYSVGAAALVPFSALEKFVLTAKTSREIARHFDVSYQLVEFRIKICSLWDMYLAAQASKIGL